MKRTFLGLAVFAAATIGANAQIHLNPGGGSFSPTGSSTEPWNVLIHGAAKAASGGEVRIAGDVYETGAINTACRLTSSGGPRRIGASPISETTLRCIAYNVWLGAPSGLSSTWAQSSRAAALRAYDWKNPDVFGFCEVWDVGEYNDHLRFILGPHSINGFNYVGSLQHSGLVTLSRHPMTQGHRGVYSQGSGADWFASKGWLRFRIEKDGFRIWVFMTHMQADDGITWNEIYSTRRSQLIQLRDDLIFIRDIPAYASDVFVIMGDLNVFGEDREPTGSREQDEYSEALKVDLGTSIGGGMDIAKSFFPNPGNLGAAAYTFTNANTLAVYHYPGFGTGTSARLDYIIAVHSKDGKVRIHPTEYELIKAMAGADISEGGHTDRNLSDHYGVGGNFRIMRVAN